VLLNQNRWEGNTNLGFPAIQQALISSCPNKLPALSRLFLKLKRGWVSGECH
jgi:hypothetical protein